MQLTETKTNWTREEEGGNCDLFFSPIYLLKKGWKNVLSYFICLISCDKYWLLSFLCVHIHYSDQIILQGPMLASTILCMCTFYSNSNIVQLQYVTILAFWNPPFLAWYSGIDFDQICCIYRRVKPTDSFGLKVTNFVLRGHSPSNYFHLSLFEPSETL